MTRRACRLALAVLATTFAATGTAAAAPAPTPLPATAPLPTPAAVTEDRHPGAGAPVAAPVAGAPDRAVAVTEVDLTAFELIGVTLPAAVEPVLVRVRRSGAWGPWHELGFDGDAADGAEAVAALEAGTAGVHSAPVWVGPADGYEVLLPPGTGPPLVHLVRAAAAPAPARPAVASAAAPIGAASTSAASPRVYGRSEWGARPMRGTPVEADDLQLAVVHHSVSVNDYPAAAVPAMLRSIQAYHMDVHGWSDAGYNFAVDRFGRIWEFRAGGILNAIVGGHAAGFNTRAVGVVLLGDHQTVAPSSAATNAVAEIIAWRFAVAQSDPRGTVDYTTVTGSTRYPPGTTVRLPRVAGHRDVGATACPGTLAYDILAGIRARVATRYQAYAGTTLTRWLTSPTHRYSDLGGVGVGAPDTTSPGPGHLDVYARGTDSQLFLSRWRGTGWQGWIGLGGQLTSAPAAVASPDGDVDVFAVGADGAVWFRSLRDDRWAAWATIGGHLTSAPEVARGADGSLVVAGRGGDGAIWLRTRRPSGGWSPWSTVGGGTPAGASPGLAADATGLALFVTGGDGALWTRTMAGGAGRGWQRVGGALTSGVSAATPEGGEVHVTARGGDGRLWAVRRVDGRWSSWQPISRERVGAGAGVASWGPGRLDLATITPDGRIFQNWWLPPAGW